MFINNCMFFRSITLQEANSFLPLVKERCEQIRILLIESQVNFDDLLLSKIKNDQTSKSNPFEFKEIISLEEEKEIVEKNFQELEVKILDQVISLGNLGAKVQNIQPIRISFLSERHKQPVYLSWQAGEKKLTYWHGVDEPFSFRRQIDNIEEFGQIYIN